MANERFPEMHDLVAVMHPKERVDFYGYVYDIDYDLRNPRVAVEFWPGEHTWFDMGEVTLMEYPEKKK